MITRSARKDRYRQQIVLFLRSFDDHPFHLRPARSPLERALHKYRDRRPLIDEHTNILSSLPRKYCPTAADRDHGADLN